MAYNRRSKNITQGVARSPNRSMYYAMGYEKSDFLFDMELPAKSPGSAGTIAINTDIENGGKAIDVFEIKVSVSQ